MFGYSIHAETLVEMCAELFGREHGAVLPARAAETNHKVLKSTRQIVFNRLIDKVIYISEK